MARLDDSIMFGGRNPQASYSALTLHRKCPQAWTYRYGMGIERLDDTPTPYLTAGIWWSALRAVEAISRANKHNSLRFAPGKLTDKAEGYSFDPAEAAVDDVLRAAEQRWKRMGRDEQELFAGELGAPLAERLAGMYLIWSAANEERHDRERPVAVEMFWKRQLPRPKNDTAWSLIDEGKVPTMNLVGYVDEVYWDRKRGMHVIMDGKAPKTMSGDKTSLDDLMDSQLMLYAWGIAPQFDKEGLSAPRAISYDRTVSVAPKQPVLTASGGLSKSVTAYDRQTYLEWASADERPSQSEVDLKAIELCANIADNAERLSAIAELQDRIYGALSDMAPGPFWGKLGEFYVTGAKKGQPKFGTYSIDQKILDNLSSPAEEHRWTKRTIDPVNKAMVRTHLRSAVDTARDVYQTQLRVEKLGDAARNFDRMGCRFCDFRDLCRAQVVGGPGGEYDLESFGLRQKPRHAAKAAEESEVSND